MDWLCEPTEIDAMQTNRLFCLSELFYASLYLLHFTQGPFYIFSLMATVFFPIAIGKLAIALVQGYLACLNLGTVDVTERAAEREAKKKAKWFFSCGYYFRNILISCQEASCHIWIPVSVSEPVFDGSLLPVLWPGFN